MTSLIQFKRNYDWAREKFQALNPSERITRSEFGAYIWSELFDYLKELENKVEELKDEIERLKK